VLEFAIFANFLEMMRTVLIAIAILVLNSGRAQTYEVGIFGGGTNVIGDIGRTTYIAPSGLALGGVFKWNKSKRYAWRGHLIYGEFTADDNLSDIPSRQIRNSRMQNNLLELSAGLELNFVEYNLHKLGPAFTPYLYTGLTYFRYGYQTLEAGVDAKRDGTLAVPMVVGAKLRINQFFVLGGEVGARYTFTDNLDASNPVLIYQDENAYERNRTGNLLSDDWYVFTGLTLTYTYGRKPCKDCFQ
jgi:hypothetical protein